MIIKFDLLAKNSFTLNATKCVAARWYAIASDLEHNRFVGNALTMLCFKLVKWTSNGWRSGSGTNFLHSCKIIERLATRKKKQEKKNTNRLTSSNSGWFCTNLQINSINWFDVQAFSDAEKVSRAVSTQSSFAFFGLDCNSLNNANWFLTAIYSRGQFCYDLIFTLFGDWAWLGTSAGSFSSNRFLGVHRGDVFETPGLGICFTGVMLSFWFRLRFWKLMYYK